MSFNCASVLNQSLQLSDQLHSLLLTLCEDLPHKRLSPESILEVCEAHQKESSSLPVNVYIKKMVQFVVGSVSEVSTTLIPNHLFFCECLYELKKWDLAVGFYAENWVGLCPSKWGNETISHTTPTLLGNDTNPPFVLLVSSFLC